MAEQDKMELARKTYETLCGVLQRNEGMFSQNKERLQADYLVSGEDASMRFAFTVDAERCNVRMISTLPVMVAEEYRRNMAVAIGIINYRLVHGCFDMNMANGEVRFRQCNSFYETELSAEVFSFMLEAACFVVDKYNETLILLSTGAISLDRFVEMIQESAG